MPDEVGTEATRSDLPSADESLFGDPANDRAAPVVQEEDSNDAVSDEPEGGGETAQDEQGTGDTDEQAAGRADRSLGGPEGGRVHQGRQGHHRGAAALIGPAHRDVRRPGRIRADPGGLGGGRKGEGQMGG